MYVLLDEYHIPWEMRTGVRRQAEEGSANVSGVEKFGGSQAMGWMQGLRDRQHLEWEQLRTGIKCRFTWH